LITEVLERWSASTVDLRMAASLLTDDQPAHFSAAETNVLKALSLAPDHAVAHSILGLIYIFTNRAAQGIAECEHALLLDRNLAAAHSAIGLAKYLTGQSAETEGHILEALSLSPRDMRACQWMQFAGMAKLHLGADAEAAEWLRRCVKVNPNYPLSHFGLAAALALLGSSDQASAAAKAGLALDPSFTIGRYRDGAYSDNPAYLAKRERVCQGMRIAGVPEG
jgi:tetratricopeptide (TPR) repeat protein